MELKPTSLPDLGERLKTGDTKYANVSNPNFNGVAGGQWRLDITWEGYFAYDPYNTKTGAPSPAQRFRYGQKVYYKDPIKKTDWVKVASSKWPFVEKGLNEYWWSDRSPQTLYKWKPDIEHKAMNNTDKKAAGTTPAATTNDAGYDTPTLNKKLSGSIRYNPPLHRYSIGHTPPFEKGYTGPSSTRLGIIYTPTQITDTSGTYDHRWGFRFQYNPTYWGYNMTSTSDTTPTQLLNGVADQQPLPGTTTWNLELYLNRIADLKPDNQKTSLYAPNISSKVLKQIVARGTEYDLDFLYRVINGDPKKIVTGNQRPSTANIGFLQMQRVGVRLSHGAWFYGMVTGINVEHVMTTRMLVPMFTRVSLTITEFVQTFQGKGSLT